MATHANTILNNVPQAPDTAIRLYHFWNVAHRVRHDPLLLHSSAKMLELVEEEENAFLNLQTVRATTELGKALQLKAWAIYHGGFEQFPHVAKTLENRRDLIGPRSFEKVLADFIAADKEYVAVNPEDQDTSDIAHGHRSNALFSLFAARPETVGQAREILRAIVHEMRECELTVGGPLPDAIELALGNILSLLDAMNPAAAIGKGGR